MASKIDSVAPIDGLDKLLADLQKMSEAAMPDLIKLVHSSAQITLDKAIALAPVYSGTAPSKVSHAGTLKRSLKLTKPRNKKGLLKAVSKISFITPDAAYAVPLELGHNIVDKKGVARGSAAPHPFLRPAADQTGAAVIARMAEGMGKIIEKNLKGAKP